MKINVKKETLIKVIAPIPIGFLATALMLAGGFLTDYGQVFTFFVLLAVLPCFSVWYSAYCVRHEGRSLVAALYCAACLTVGYLSFGFSNWLKNAFYFIWIFTWTLFPSFIYKLTLNKKKLREQKKEKEKEGTLDANDAPILGMFKFSVFFLALAKSFPIILVTSLIGIIIVGNTFPHRYNFVHKEYPAKEATIEIVKLKYIIFEHVWDRDNGRVYWNEEEYDFDKYYSDEDVTVICTVDDTEDFVRKLYKLRFYSPSILEHQGFAVGGKYISYNDQAYSKYAARIIYPDGSVEIIMANGTAHVKDPNIYINEHSVNIDAFYKFLEDQRVSNRK
ncbi:MAG: hypothetical protein J6D45_09915 [Clostridia bacterium]|nr:hypothetical protein [Clostridia bacterium]